MIVLRGWWWFDSRRLIEPKPRRHAGAADIMIKTIIAIAAEAAAGSHGMAPVAHPQPVARHTLERMFVPHAIACSARIEICADRCHNVV